MEHGYYIDQILLLTGILPVPSCNGSAPYVHSVYEQSSPGLMKICPLYWHAKDKK